MSKENGGENSKISVMEFMLQMNQLRAKNRNCQCSVSVIFSLADLLVEHAVIKPFGAPPHGVDCGPRKVYALPCGYMISACAYSVRNLFRDED